MKPRLIDVLAALCTGLFLLSATATAQQALVTKALTEKKVSQLPARPLFWRVENFPMLIASDYVLRVNEATGPPGSITPVHTHPGSEAFYVLAGEQCIRTSQKMIRVVVGRAETGPGGDTPLQVSSCGSTDLLSLVVFVVDATRPFSSPASFP